MGKLVAAFIFFLAASALAIREAKPPSPHVEDVVAPPPRAEEPPPSRAVHEETPPWVKYAAPAPPPPPAIVTTPVPPRRFIMIEPSTITFESEGDIPDAVDKCPDQPSGRDDEDGCPEPYNGPASELDKRIILID